MKGIPWSYGRPGLWKHKFIHPIPRSGPMPSKRGRALQRRKKAIFYSGKTVLVTGGSGFVGSHIVEALVRQGARVRVPIHKRAVDLENTAVETFRADLQREEDCMEAVKGVDYVFHAAGSVGSASLKVDKAMASITGNLIMTSLMLQAAWSGKVKRFLLFGSSTGYPVSDHPVKEEEMWEGPPFEGYWGYGWMRRYLERLGEFVHSQSGVKVALARPTAVYGRRDNFEPDSSHVIPGLIRRAVEREDPFEVWGSGKEVRDFLHVSDLARGCLLLLEKHAECDPVNIGYGGGTTIRELARVVLGAAGHGGARVVFNASRPTAIPVRVVDTSKAKKILGFDPAVSLEEGVKDTVEWYVERRRKEQGASGP